jgi:transcriptional regulator with XRE-family HTH domain
MLSYMESAATLIRRARIDGGLSARALAERADVPASTVTRIESGQVDPTMGMLAKIIHAAGGELEVTFRVQSKHRPDLADLAAAWIASPEDRPDLRKFRAFIDYLRLHSDEVESSIACPPTRTASPILGALLAGVAEKLADDAALPRPPWTHRIPGIGHEWSMPGTPRMIERWRQEAPPQLRNRGLVIDESSLWRNPETIGA